MKLHLVELQPSNHISTCFSRDDVRRAMAALGTSYRSLEELAETLPFSAGDVTAGTENELQAAVAGEREQVDLPLSISQSSYFANITKRAASGELTRRPLADLEEFLAENDDRIWENSWVRLPFGNLSSFAREVFERDLLADKEKPSAGRRADADRFFLRGKDGETWLRLPVSYLIKLALADVIDGIDSSCFSRNTGIRLMDHFLNDNTSPETFSFNVVDLVPERGMGRAIASETALRYLFTQLLIMYANEAFGLRENGQTAMAYFAPLPPVRQKELNDLTSDSFYRELFMSPCLSGWNRGEEKHRYMHLCHQMLSRSQLNAVAKLRESGIISTNLVVLPNLSNISLANNGTHISIGSRRMTAALGNPGSGFSAYHEKYFGDLAVKIAEHFMPLFVGIYSAAPMRLSFTDFHPERVLGFLPHELDYTHLRMLWRRWRKKADISILGQPLTPFGPAPLDRAVSALFRLKGDFVPDFRLMDYLVCLLSTNESPSLDGISGNNDRLKRDLAQMGVFDEQMSLYLLYKQREFDKMGFSGFEGRHYSLFENFAEDLGRATDLQTLVTALAFKYIALGSITHAHIPDTPVVESERRQPFFGAAIDLPTFFVRQESGNRFILEILKRTRGVRSSHRYQGYVRVQLNEYRKALLELLKEDASDLIELMNLRETLEDLERRLDDPATLSCSGRLTRGILKGCGGNSPMKIHADDFNREAERFYRDTLRLRHMEEAFSMLKDSCASLNRESAGSNKLAKELYGLFGATSAESFVEDAGRSVVAGDVSPDIVRRLLHLMLIVAAREGDVRRNTFTGEAVRGAPVHRAG